MGAPETIEVRFSEDLAQYADVRPVRVQPMTLTELAGLVITQTGKDRDRVRELLHLGTCHYNIYKYWWDPVDPDYTELEVALDAYPDPDPSRSFDPGRCRLIRFTDSGEPRPRIIEIAPEEGDRKRLLAQESLWVFLLRFSASRHPLYRDYSYYDKADRYGLRLQGAMREELVEGIQRVARRGLRRQLDQMAGFEHMDLLCSRP